MATTELLHHHISGPRHAPLLVLGPSLGTSMTIWAPHLATLSSEFRVLRFDLPGHGGSATALLPDAESGSTTVEDLAALVLRLVDHYDHTQFHYAGISLGGAIGAHLAVHFPERIDSLALVCSSAHFGEAGPWQERAALVRLKGTEPLLTTSPARWFADPEISASPLGRSLLNNLALAEAAGYAACCDALAAYDLRPSLGHINAPTLVIGGTEDVATPLDHAWELTDAIPRADMRLVRTGHLALEQPKAVEIALITHLRSHGTTVGRKSE